MARKTFIKVRIGILEPKHIFQIGEAIWLYLYILNRADWKTGKIFDWRDADVAQDLGIYVQSVRNQRKKLALYDYIAVSQKKHRQELTVLKWQDPNPKGGQSNDDNYGDNELSPSAPNDDNYGDSNDDNYGDSGLSPLHIVKNTDNRVKTIYSESQISPIQKLIESITGVMPTNQADLNAIQEIEKLNPTEQDIRAGFEWLKSQGVKLRRYTSLVNPISVCMSKRLNKPMTTLEKSKAAVMQVLAELEAE